MTSCGYKKLPKKEVNVAIPMNYETRFTWTGDTMRGILSIDGLDDIALGGAEERGVLDPEHMLLGAAEACHFNTFRTIAANSGVDLRAYRSTASGELSLTKGQGYQFARIVIRPEITVAEADLKRAQRIMEKAHGMCLITRSLNCPCDMEV
ncbi:MAG TPA: hypothetical protein ENN56_02955, partial [Firmicutes bacterium]|nr:hypothetical protein [Bacillota bacterium]